MRTKKIIGILFCIGGLLLSLNTIRITGNVIGFSEYFNPQLIVSILVFLFGALLLFTENLETKVDAGEFLPLDEREKADAEYLRYSSVDHAVEKLHEGKYKAVFLTQTSSIPWGFVVKEAYKTKYPNEKAPAFLTIDVKGIRGLRGNKSEETTVKLLADNLVKKTAEKMRKYKIGDGDNIILLDEKSPDSGNYSSFKEWILSKGGQNYHTGNTAGIAYHVLGDAFKSSNTKAKLEFDYLVGQGLRDPGAGGTNRHKGIAGWTHAIKNGVDYARRYFGAKERKISKENINYLKELGRMSANEANEQRNDRVDKMYKKSL